jgi:TolB-like protein/DNA-binding winged helix-turn-helix (wHTH) protein/tetratricopeptide (TPR) repeat protein
MSEQSRRSYEFGPFSADPIKRLLLRNGEPVPLSPKALETLLALIESRDRVLTKDELLKQVWGDTIVEEGGLTKNISLLRKALGEKPDTHQYIVTVPARGYQFVADVREMSGNDDESRADLPMDAASDSRETRSFLASRWLVPVGLAALALGTITYVLHADRAIEPGPPAIRSLAVLPLENLSGDITQEYFADGVTEALITNLAGIRALRVVSRTSVMRFKETRPSLSEIARALNVDAVIEGSVQRTSDRMKISLKLIHAGTDTHLWAREYERELMDVLKLQGEVARAVADEIRIQVTPEERARMASTATVHPAAHQEYLLGRYHLWKTNEDDLKRAIDHFEGAIHLDPVYAAAYAGLSQAWWARGIYGAMTPKDVKASSRAAARKALELNDRLAEAHVAIGRDRQMYDWDWTGAEKSFGHALEIDPNNVDAHYFFGFLLMGLGRFFESISLFERAEQLDPLSSTVQSGFGRILYRARRFDEAISHFNRAIALEPRNHAAYRRLGDVYEAMGRYAEALAAQEKANALAGRAPGPNADMARTYARMGKRREARQILETLRNRPAGLPVVPAAGAYAALDDRDEAFRVLFRNVEERNGPAPYVNVDPTLDSLHSDPRWSVLLRRMNLPIVGDGNAVVSP